MANTKKNFWYVLVMSDGGPVFVTSVNYANKTAEWDKSEKPLELDVNRAQDLAMGLCLNFHMAYAVCQSFELDSQPYNYQHWNIKWEEKEDEEDEAV